MTFMIDFERGLYVYIHELAHGPHPMPLSNGFCRENAYRVLGLFNPSESGECWLILSNDGDQLWHIAQRHVRTLFVDPSRLELRVPRLSREPAFDQGFAESA